MRIHDRLEIIEHDAVAPKARQPGKLDKAMAVNAAATVAAAIALAAARKRRPAPGAVAIAAQMALTLDYWRLMAEYYDRSQRATRRFTPDRGRGGGS